jgi:hypothetical protein
MAALCVSASLAAGLTCAALQAQTSATPVSYQKLRQEENWSSLSVRDPSDNPDLFDPVKFVPLNESNNIWMSLGGHIRVRGESWSNYNLSDAPSNSDTFGLGRVFLHADIHVGPNVRFFVEGKTAVSTNRNLPGGRRTGDVDTADLLNAFVDVTTPLSDSSRFTVRAGRQQLLFGKERLVGVSSWGNTVRTFEGFSGKLQLDNWSVTGFWTQPVTVSKYSFNRRDRNTDFFGVYAAGRVPGTKVGLDLFLMTLDQRQSTFNGTIGPEKRHTLGTRFWGAIPRSDFDYEVEAAYQFGDLGSGGISAHTAMGQLGYQFKTTPMAPRLYTEIDYASGDKQPGGDVQTFNRLFPTSHAVLGFADVVGWQNVVDLIAGITLKPLRRVSVDLSGHNFWRADENDAVYTPGGAVFRAGAPGSPKRVGSEVDAILKYALRRHMDFGFGYTHFFPGKFLEETGPAKNLILTYLWAQYTF